MAYETRNLKLCNCNRTMAIDAGGLQKALKLQSVPHVHHELCRRESGEFAAAIRGGDCVVACTQEAPLFGEIADAEGAAAELRVLNIREHAGWSAEGANAMPKMAALLALADLPDPEPLPAVTYRSGGSLFVIGPAEPALRWAAQLSGQLEPCVLLTDIRSGAAQLPAERRYPVWSGSLKSVSGHLGAFEVEWEQQNPVDLEACTRCGACVKACPEHAIGNLLQIDLAICKAHRECVAACGTIAAIDFERADRSRQERFDVVLDLGREPAIRLAQPPQGYFAPGADPMAQALAAIELLQFSGEFEKPRYFSYTEKICAHSRSAKPGCSKCIDVCSTGAISANGDGVAFDAHLCMGCGGCATVCPTGAVTHAYPRASDLGLRLKTLLSTYRNAGGKDACILFHDAAASRDLIAGVAREGRGLPARVIPLEVHHPASLGIDVLLGVLAYGASQVIQLASPDENAAYGEAVHGQHNHARRVLEGLGFGGTHLHWLACDSVDTLEGALWSLQPAAAAAKPAVFDFVREKRVTLEFAIEHLAQHAPSPAETIALGTGAPWGRVEVDRKACTLCMACVGACPASALVDGRETPMLKFIERNCVQCGLCKTTCPESAITLMPRLSLAKAARTEIVLNEAEPFHCVSCGKAFATRQMIDNMLGKLRSHSMFAGGQGLRRLQMCADCRVIDMMANKGESSILDPEP